MQTLLTSMFFVLGSIFGSFLNVVIIRLPKNETIVHGRSHCIHCEHELGALELIPILSYIGLNGKCRVCKSPISMRYPLIETLTAILFALSYLRFGFTVELIIALLLNMLLVTISIIDFDTYEIYDRFQIMLLILSLSTLFISKLSYWEHFIGFFIISVPLYLIAVLTDGIGGGDIKLMAIAGLMLGYQSTLVAFFVGTLIGSIYAIYLLRFKSASRKSQLAFGPFLCLGIFIAFHYGPQIINAYIQLWT